MFTTKGKALRLVALTVFITIYMLDIPIASAAHRGTNGKIAFVANLTGTNQIYTQNPDGTGLFQVTDLPPASDEQALSPDISPDGTRIVFPHDMTGALELYIINVDGTGLTQITHDGLFHAIPRWSPDGSHIVCALGGKYNLSVIATLRADGSDQQTLTTPVWESFGAYYTPDGSHIVFSSQQGGLVSALWIMDTNGKHQRRLTEAELEAGPPDVSPDGTQVVSYAHQDTPKTTYIFKMNIAGTGVTQLTPDGHNEGEVVFSPNGKKILFVSDRLSPGSFDVFIMNADGSHQGRLIPGAYAPTWGVQPPD